MSADLNQCELQALLYHEVTHAIDFCNQPDGGKGITQRIAKKRRPLLKANCEQWAASECMPTAEKDEFVKKCVDDGVAQSCNQALKNQWNPCTKDKERLFPLDNTFDRHYFFFFGLFFLRASQSFNQEGAFLISAKRSSAATRTD